VAAIGATTARGASPTASYASVGAGNRAAIA
jgi:hypothetical protein